MKLTAGRLRVVHLLGVCLLVLGLAERSASAGAWNREQWGFYLQLGTAFTDATQRFNPLGNRTKITVIKNEGSLDQNSVPSHFQQLLTDLYFEVGLLKRLTLVGDVGFIASRLSNEGGNIVYRSYGASDVMFGLRVQIIQDPVALALEAHLYGPVANSTDRLPLGSGDFRGDMRLALGKAWELKIPIYTEAEVGVLFRGKGSYFSPLMGDVESVNYSPEVFVHAEFGATVLRINKQNRLALNVGLDYRGSTSRDTDSGVFVLIPQWQELTTISGGVVGYLWRGLGLSLRAWGAVEGKQTLQSANVQGALFASF